jgi:hypothetical protein
MRRVGGKRFERRKLLLRRGKHRYSNRLSLANKELL